MIPLRTLDHWLGSDKLMRIQSRTLFWLFLLFLTVLQQGYFSGYTMDDAFISFRYARNVAQGDGWVYNVGGEPVEGFTNFLWTLLLVPCFWLKLEPMPIAQILGATCSLSVLGLTWKLAQGAVNHRQSWMPLWAPLLLMVTGAFTYQAVTGLETHLFSLGLVLGVYFFLRGDQMSLAYSAAGFTIACLTRPEGIFLYTVSLVFLLNDWHLHHQDRRALFAFFVPFAVPMAVFFLWRYFTFGQWLPNTYFTKVGSLQETVPEGWKYVYTFFQTHGTTLPWILVLIPLVVHRFRVREVYLFALLVAHLGVVIYEGGDWMPLHRTLAPILPILYLLTAEGMDLAWQFIKQIQQERNLSLRAIQVLCTGWAAVTLAVLFYPSIAVFREAQVRPQLYESSHVSLGRWLKEQCQPGDRIALSDIGQIGYYSDLWVIDLVGLTDRTIAHSPGGLHRKQYDPLYVLDQKPRYIVLVCAKVGAEFVIRGFETDKVLYRHPRFKQEYQLLREISDRFFYKEAYSYWVFQRRA